MAVPGPPRTAQEWANIAAGFYERLPRLEAETDEAKSNAIAACGMAKEARDMAKEARDAIRRVEEKLDHLALTTGGRDRAPSVHDVDQAVERLAHRMDEWEETTSPGMLTRAELEARLAARERDSMRVKLEAAQKLEDARRAQEEQDAKERAKRVWYMVGAVVIFTLERIIEALLKGHL